MRIEEKHGFENRGAMDREKMVILARQEIDIDPPEVHNRPTGVTKNPV